MHLKVFTKYQMLCNAYDDMSGFSILNTRGVTSSHRGHPSSSLLLTGFFIFLHKNKHKNTLGQQGLALALALALVIQVLVVLVGCGCLRKIILVGNDTPQTILERVTKARQALEMQLKCKGKITNLFGFLFKWLTMN